jgi:hypothetical protein
MTGKITKRYGLNVPVPSCIAVLYGASRVAMVRKLMELKTLKRKTQRNLELFKSW